MKREVYEIRRRVKYFRILSKINGEGEVGHRYYINKKRWEFEPNELPLKHLRELHEKLFAYADLKTIESKIGMRR